MLQVMQASWSKANDESPYPGLSRRSSKVTAQAGVVIDEVKMYQ
jgi:hypothetical protein